MRKLILIMLLAVSSTVTLAQKNNYQLSSHILDISKGAPAPGVKIKLEKYNEHLKNWTFIDEKTTDINGRITNFLAQGQSNLGIYKLIYHTHDYFKKNNTESFYPFIEVVFQIKDDSHYHVPITLSAYGYSTYRGN